MHVHGPIIQASAAFALAIFLFLKVIHEYRPEILTKIRRITQINKVTATFTGTIYVVSVTKFEAAVFPCRVIFRLFLCVVFLGQLDNFGMVSLFNEKVL